MLNVIIIEIYYSILIRKNFSLNSIIEYDFFLSIFIHSLYLSIVSNNLLNNFHISGCFIMIFGWELHIEVFLLFVCIRLFTLFNCNWCLLHLLLFLLSNCWLLLLLLLRFRLLRKLLLLLLLRKDLLLLG